MAKGSTGTSMGGTMEYVSFKEVNKARRQQQAQKKEAAKKREQAQKQKQKKASPPKKEKQRKHCYAVHFLDNDEKVIIMSWDECQARTKGRTNNFKGFQSVEEAQAWLDGGAVYEKKPSKPAKPKENSGATEKKPGQVDFTFSLSRSDARKFRRLAQSMGSPVETLIQNLILEYLYDIEDKNLIPPDSDEPPF